jgi:hypothetical protein
LSQRKLGGITVDDVDDRKGRESSYTRESKAKQRGGVHIRKKALYEYDTYGICPDAADGHLHCVNNAVKCHSGGQVLEVEVEVEGNVGEEEAKCGE